MLRCFTKQTARRRWKGWKMPFFSAGDLDLWASNSSDRGTEHIFHAKLAQIRLAVPEILHIQTKNPQTDGTKTEPTAVHW